MVPLLQPDLTPASLHDDRLGQSLDALCAAHLNRVFGAMALTPTVCLGVTSSVAYTYGYDNGRIGPTRCALIDGARGDRWRRCQGGSTPPAGARSAHSGLAVGSRRASTADPGGFPRSKTTRRSASTPCDDASRARCALGTRPSRMAKISERIVLRQGAPPPLFTLHLEFHGAFAHTDHPWKTSWQG